MSYQPAFYGNSIPVRHTVINIHGSGFRGQQTFINGIPVNIHGFNQPQPQPQRQRQSTHIIGTKFVDIGRGRILKTDSWSDGSYESWEGYYGSSGHFVSLQKTHSR